MNLLKTVNKPH